VRGAYNKVPVSSGQCQVFSNEFIPLNQVTFECYLLDRLSSITWYLSKNQFFSFLELAGVKRNGTENVVSFRANFVVFQTFDRRSHRLVTSVRPSGIEAAQHCKYLSLRLLCLLVRSLEMRRLFKLSKLSRTVAGAPQTSFSMARCAEWAGKLWGFG